MTATFPPTSSPTFTPGVPAATPTPVVTTTTTTTTASGSAPKNNNPKKIFGMEVRALATVLGLTLFFVLAMAGVVISLRQRFAPEEVATPNAPTSQPSADVVKEATCTLSFVVEPDGSPSPSPSPSPSVSPSPSPSVSPSPTPSAGTYTCNSLCTTNQQCSDVNSAYICTSEGRCRLESNTTNAECKPADTTTYVCNSECTTNDQCADANPNYICSDNRCRLQTNPGNNECRERTTVSVGCNDTCVTNSDCSNPDHICNDNKCRLASNPGSASCSNPPTTTTTTTTTPTQPELPAELPKTGPEDLGIWLKGGFAALAVGALLLILL